MFEDYARDCAVKTNWKYWVFAQLLKPLGESFDKTLGSTNFEHTASNAMVWLDQSCSLPHMRTLVTDQLKNLCVSSSTVLDRPESFAQEMVSLAANIAPTHEGAAAMGRQVVNDYEEQLDETDQDA